MSLYHLKGSCYPRGFFLSWRRFVLGGIQTHRGSLSVCLQLNKLEHKGGKNTDDILDSQPDD